MNKATHFKYLGRNILLHKININFRGNVKKLSRCVKNTWGESEEADKRAHDIMGNHPPSVVVKRMY